MNWIRIREVSNADIAEARSMLHTLHALGYLMRTSRTRRFYPTGRLLETARRIAESDPLIALAQEAVDQLAERTNESAFFGVLEPMAVKVAAAAASRLPLRYILDVGERVALHASALGKSMLGLLPEDEARSRLDAIRRPAVTPHTVVDVDRLLDQLERGRELGWYEAHDEGTPGVTALAVSLWMGGQPVGLSLAGPVDRIEKHRETYLSALREVSQALQADN